MHLFTLTKHTSQKPMERLGDFSYDTASGYWKQYSGYQSDDAFKGTDLGVMKEDNVTETTQRLQITIQ